MKNIIEWLNNCKGKKAMLYVLTWMMLPCFLLFIALIVGLIYIKIAVFIALLGVFVWLVLTAGLFIMIINAN